MKTLYHCLWLLAAMLLPATAGDSMLTKGLTSQPIGHYNFCNANPAECQKTKLYDRIILGPEGWDVVLDVNLAVNAEVHAVSDFQQHNKDEVWSFPTTLMGDCEDYALEKRRRLHQAGIPLSSLLITVVRKPDGEGHAVLTLLTSQGDFVLDNLRDEIRLWNRTDYRFLKRQSEIHAGRWISLDNQQTTAYVAATQK